MVGSISNDGESLAGIENKIADQAREAFPGEEVIILKAGYIGIVGRAQRRLIRKPEGRSRAGRLDTNFLPGYWGGLGGAGAVRRQRDLEFGLCARFA